MQQVREYNVTASSGSPVQLVPGNNTRLYLIVSQPTTSVAIMGLTPSELTGMSTFGIIISQTLPIMLSRETAGIAVTMPWYVSTLGMGLSIYALEVFDPDVPFPPVAANMVPVEAAMSGQSIVGEGIGVDSPDPIVELIRKLEQYAKATANRLR